MQGTQITTVHNSVQSRIIQSSVSVYSNIMHGSVYSSRIQGSVYSSIIECCVECQAQSCTPCPSRLLHSPMAAVSVCLPTLGVPLSSSPGRLSVSRFRVPCQPAGGSGHLISGSPRSSGLPRPHACVDLHFTLVGRAVSHLRAGQAVANERAPVYAYGNVITHRRFFL